MKYLISLLVTLAVFSGRAETKLSDDRIIFRTNFGDIVVALYPEVAPQHTQQITRLAEKGLFDQTSFYRLEKGFVLQIENYSNRAVPFSEKQQSEIIQIPAEFSDVPHRRGLLSMARYDEDVNSAETSFSFMLGSAPHLDGQYTVFGEIVEGMDVLAMIERVDVDEDNVPLVPIFIKSTKVVSANDLARVQLRGAMNPQVPNDNYTFFFKIFAAMAFAITVLQPFAKTFWDRFRATQTKTQVT